MAALKLKVEFGGGLELLFSNQRTHLIDIPPTVPRGDREGQPVDIEFLIRWLKDNLLKERPELFIEDGMLRPGILVLVNDTDWELEGEGGYELKGGDEIAWLLRLSVLRPPPASLQDATNEAVRQNADEDAS